MTNKFLQRTDGPLAGVCGGLAEYFGMDPTIIRVMFILGLVIGGGFSLLVYIVLWIAMPHEDEV